MLPFKTILLVDPDEVLHQSAEGVLKDDAVSKMEHSNGNWSDKLCQIVCSILFDLFYFMTSSTFCHDTWKNYSPSHSAVLAVNTYVESKL